MGQVIIGMDPHKGSATVEVINDREKVLAQGRFGTDLKIRNPLIADESVRPHACGCHRRWR
jgi:hypothetical protein